jgi:hypothetical protein
MAWARSALLGFGDGVLVLKKLSALPKGARHLQSAGHLA